MIVQTLCFQDAFRLGKDVRKEKEKREGTPRKNKSAYPFLIRWGHQGYK